MTGCRVVVVALVVGCAIVQTGREVQTAAELWILTGTVTAADATRPRARN